MGTPDIFNNLGFLSIPEPQEKILSAAKRTGEAGAMAVSLTNGGCAERAQIWKGEEAVWDERTQQQIAAMPGNQSLLAEAARQARNEAYQATYIDIVSICRLGAEKQIASGS